MDDWAIAATQLISLVVTGVIFFRMYLTNRRRHDQRLTNAATEIHSGSGRHVSNLSQQQIENYRLALYMAIIPYAICLVLLKLAVLLQYQRIFAQTSMQRCTRHGIRFLGVLLVVTAVGSAIPCVPVRAYWDASVKGKCLSFRVAYLPPSVLNILLDFVIFAIPLPAVKSLQLPERQKIVLLVSFGLGFL